MDGKLLKKVSWNISGVVFPFIAALISIPFLLENLGAEKFAVVSLSWALVGYLGILDFGLGKALTRSLSLNEYKNNPVKRFLLIRSTTNFLVIFGVFWLILLVVLSGEVTSLIIGESSVTAIEIQASVIVIAFAIPFVMYAASRISKMEAEMRFEEINKVKILTGMGMFILPTVASFVTTFLPIILLAITLSRVFSSLAFSWMNKMDVQDGDEDNTKVDMAPLFKFGGWLTVSSTLSPLMQYFDRFVVAAKISLAQVSYYTVPFDVLIRLTAFPAAFMSVLYPLMVKNNEDNSSDQKRFFLWALIGGAALWGPGILVLFFSGEMFLSLWAGEEVVKNQGGQVWDMILIGVFANGLAYIPMTHLHSLGKTNITAAFHLIELPIYLFLLFNYGISLGIVGVALIWSLRSILDLLLLLIASTYFERSILIINICLVMLVCLVSAFIYLYGNYFETISI